MGELAAVKPPSPGSRLLPPTHDVASAAGAVVDRLADVYKALVEERPRSMGTKAPAELAGRGCVCGLRKAVGFELLRRIAEETGQLLGPGPRRSTPPSDTTLTSPCSHPSPSATSRW